MTGALRWLNNKAKNGPQIPEEVVCLLQDPNSTRGEQWSARNRLIKELMHLGITFDHFGECKFGTDAAAVQLPVPHKLGVSHHVITAQRRKVQILKHYKFALGMENFVREDYVTEKFYHMFASRCHSPIAIICAHVRLVRSDL